MSTTIGSSDANSGYSVLDGVNYQGSIAGQTFKAPNAGDTVFIFDKIDIRLDVNPDQSPGFGFNASLFEWNGNSQGQILRTTTGNYTGGGLPQDITIDFEDVILDPTKTYGFGILANSGSTANRIQMGSGYADGAYLMESNNTWSVSQNGTDIYFTIYLNTVAGARASELVPLYIPTGNYDESTDIGIDLSGSFRGIGQFSIPNPAQSGNTYVRYGRYGKLHLSTSGEFQYFIDDEKLTNVNTGQNVVDEFPITLTYPDGSQASSTYRVQIAGYSDRSAETDQYNKQIRIMGFYAEYEIRPGVYKQGIWIDGDAIGLEVGSRVIPYFRIQGEKGYQKAKSQPILNGTPFDQLSLFNWKKLADRKIFVRFTDESGQVKSNRVVVDFPSSDKSQRIGLAQQVSDPIISGGYARLLQNKSYETDSRINSPSSLNSFYTNDNKKDFSSPLMVADPLSFNGGSTDTGLLPVASGAFI